MNLHISQHDGVPIYLQIIKQIKNLIISERLAIDQELLPIRSLAEQLVINPNTVARSYRELETEGWIYKKRGSGTFVSEVSKSLTAESSHQQITKQVESLLTEAEQLNISSGQIIQMIRKLSDHGSKE